MATSDPELWQRLAGFEIGAADAALTFTRRLARENRWSDAFARRVLEEYRRFVYLCMVAGRPMTPSDPVDQAWHLHLSYTRSYWRNLCRDVLGRPLHHEPTRGGPAERAKFEVNYVATLEAYRREFGATPPADVWPDPHARFAPARFQRIDTGTHLLIGKRELRQAGRLAAVLLLLPAALLACTLVEVQSDGRWTLTEAGVVVGFLAIGVPAVLLWQWQFLHPKEKKRRGDGGCGGGCDSGCGGCGGCSD